LLRDSVFERSGNRFDREENASTGSREENASNKETSRGRHDRPDRRTKQKGRRKAGLFLEDAS